MGTLPPTTHLGLVLPDPGTAQPYSRAVENGWFTTIDTAFGGHEARLDAVEPYVLPTGVRPGLVPAGTSAERDAFWGVPGDAPARVALAAKAPRWFNTEKGYEQQYFAQFDDAGAGAFAKTVHGWGAAASLGLVPLRPASIANVTGTAVLHGGKVVFAGVNSVSLNGVFTADFDEYVIEYDGLASGLNEQRLRLRVAGVDQSGAGTYAYQTHHTDGTGAVAALNTGAAYMPLQGSAEHNTLGEIKIRNPLLASGKHHMKAETTVLDNGGTSVAQARVDAYHGATVACDGFTVYVGAGTLTGHLRVFGVNEY